MNYLKRGKNRKTLPYRKRSLSAETGLDSISEELSGKKTPKPRLEM